MFHHTKHSGRSIPTHVRRPLAVACSIAAATVALALSPRLAIGQQTQEFQWKTNASGNWSTPANWTRILNGVTQTSNNQAPDDAPGYNTFVTIDRDNANPTISYTAGNRAVDRLRAFERFEMTGGVLAFQNQGAQFNAQFVHTGGRIELPGNDNVEFRMPFNGTDATSSFWNGGTWNGTGGGAFKVTNGARLVINGTDGTNLNRLEARALSIDAGSLVSFDCNDSAPGAIGKLLLNAGARIENRGTLSLGQYAGGTRATYASEDGTGQLRNYGLVLAPSSGTLVYHGQGAATLNSGLMRFYGGGTSVIAGRFENYADNPSEDDETYSVDVEASTQLVLAGGGYNAASIRVGASANLSFNDTEFFNADTGRIDVGDQGRFTLLHRTHRNDGVITTELGNIQIVGGARLENRGALYLGYAGEGARVVLQSDDGTGQVLNDGVAHLDGSGGTAVVAAGPTWLNRFGGRVDVTGDVVFAGRLENYGNDGAGHLGSVAVGIDDPDTGDSASGSLELTGGGYNDGSFVVNGDSSLRVSGAAFDFRNQSGQSRLSVRTDATVTFAGGAHRLSSVIDNEGTIEVAGGVVTFDGRGNSLDRGCGIGPSGGALVVNGGLARLGKASAGAADGFGATAETLTISPDGPVYYDAPLQVGSSIAIEGRGDNVAQLDMRDAYDDVNEITLDGGGITASMSNGRLYTYAGMITSTGTSFIDAGLNSPAAPTIP